MNRRSRSSKRSRRTRSRRRPVLKSRTRRKSRQQLRRSKRVRSRKPTKRSRKRSGRRSRRIRGNKLRLSSPEVTECNKAPDLTVNDLINQTYCPHMGQNKGEYVKTTASHDLSYNGKSYTFKTCCDSCANQIISNPEDYVVDCSDCDSGLGLKHKVTQFVVQCLNDQE